MQFPLHIFVSLQLCKRFINAFSLWPLKKHLIKTQTALSEVLLLPNCYWQSKAAVNTSLTAVTTHTLYFVHSRWVFKLVVLSVCFIFSKVHVSCQAVNLSASLEELEVSPNICRNSVERVALPPSCQSLLWFTRKQHRPPLTAVEMRQTV